jgi:small subunit ribosomal protein S8e
MTKWQLRSGRKTTGGLLKRHGKKVKRQRGRDFVPAHVGETKRRAVRTKGGGKKIMALAANVANIAVKGEIKRAKILGVKENAADSQFVRRNVITKGAIIETDIGRARVTSRPGQTGVVNAILIDAKGVGSSVIEEKK